MRRCCRYWSRAALARFRRPPRSLPHRPRQRLRRPARPTPTTPTPTVTPIPTRTALYLAGDESAGVKELQARLKQLLWYEPKITGVFDEITVASVTGFQEKRGFPATGEVDQATWDKLVSMTHQPTDDEIHNRLVAGPTIIGGGDSGDQVRALQARLKQIGWFSADVTGNYGDTTTTAVAGFQTKRGFPSTGDVDQRTWDRLVTMTRAPTDDELHNRVSGNGAAPLGWIRAARPAAPCASTSRLVRCGGLSTVRC